MTIDKNRLKALAEAATQGPWHHTGTWVSTERGNSVADCPRGDEEFIAAANPITVLALLGEIERLIESRQEALELRNKMGDRLDAAEAERDSLQTQVAALQAEPNSYQSGYDAGRAAEKAHADNWRAEADGLRRDASRYRFLRNQHWPVAYLAVVINPKAAVKPGHVCPSGDRLDEQVDEAMKREASHD